MIIRRRSFLKAASCLPLSLALPSIAYTKIDFGTAKITTISDGSITLPAGLTFDTMPQPELEPISAGARDKTVSKFDFQSLIFQSLIFQSLIFQSWTLQSLIFKV